MRDLQEATPNNLTSRQQQQQQGEEDEDWLIFNDFLVERTVLEDARGFGPEWKEPCVIVYRRLFVVEEAEDVEAEEAEEEEAEEDEEDEGGRWKG